MRNDAFQSNDIEGIVKKAKRKSVIRNIMVSTISLFFIGALSLFINGMIVNHAHEKAVEANRLLFEISEPNIHIGGGTFDYGILSGTYTYNKYKLIEDRVVPWGNDFREFNALGHNENSSALSVYDEVTVGETEGNVRYYNTINGQRTMQFYHPWFEYENIYNDLDLIQNAPDDAVMEVAISFDQSYTVKEVQEFFNLKNKISWYRVNDYNLRAIEQLKGLHSSGDSASYVYGFSVQTMKGEGKMETQNEEDFLATLAKLKDTGNYRYLINPLLENVKQNMKDGIILGVVVTGTKEELLKIKQDKHIRAISLGAVATEY
ncbi:anti sigma factor C-terminal domain-containing protein [Bacillus sp. 31A1R]|uniref:Anti sigma factor C-terminal domain-containing protein n=1 Tax=Robertmurraya mangrovi TaxID=3098077 RepID=A0ABU5J0L8_9BACI|nr:anti sigma factor C-terminal domain-containing protein [Bacillus sp. 31A1R]MDZ5472965.1 anti sigma factor C-terminal domain-containing protein [Bacillus sp. 31A1R]